MTAPIEYEDRLIPPHSIEGEQSVLGGLMMDNKAFKKVAAIVSEDDFYRNDHRLIYRSIVALADDGSAFDWITMSEWLKDRGELNDAGGGAYLGTIVNDTPSAANIEHYANLVREKSIKRGMIGIGNDLIEEAYKAESAQELIAHSRSAITEFANARTVHKSRIATPKDMALEMSKRWELQEACKKAMLGIPTPFDELNEITQGLRGGHLWIFGARPKMGKTALLMAFEKAALMAGYPVAMISMEMQAQDINDRHVSSLSSVDLGKISNAKLMREDEKWKAVNACKTWKDLPYYVDDTPAHTVDSLLDSVLRMNERSIEDHGKPLGMVGIDYLQLMTTKGKVENRNTEVSKYSAACKALAKELNVPVIALSQLNRGLESRHDKRPVMADLRDSGAIEQDADLILFPYRDNVYNKETNPVEAEIAIAANRHGRTHEGITAGFEGRYTRWFDRASEIYIKGAAQ